MQIEELVPEEKIPMKKWRFSCDDPDLTIPRPLPQSLNFFLGINGKPGTGKTSLLLNLLCKRNKLYNNKFDKVYVWSPSLGTVEGDPFGSLPEEQMFTDLDEDNLKEVLQDIEDSGEKVCFVMDDVVNSIKKSPEIERILCMIAMNRRHLCGAGGGVSLILTSQVYNKVSCPLRKCFSHLIQLNGKQRKELDSLAEEHVCLPKDDFYKVVRHCFKKKHDFMYLDLGKESERMFHHNFNPLVLSQAGDLEPAEQDEKER